jgi:hypothetical protein
LGNIAGEDDMHIWRHLESIYSAAEEVTSKFQSELTPAVEEFFSLIRDEFGDEDRFIEFYRDQSSSLDRYVNDIING